MNNFAAPEIKVGTYIEVEGWKHVGQKLTPGLEGFCSYYIPTGYEFGVTMLACNIKVTGKVAIKRFGDYYARVEITFVGDGEPDSVTHGWTPCGWGWGRGAG